MIQEFKSKGGLEAQTLLGMITVEQGDTIAGMEMIRNAAERENSIAEIFLYGPNEKTGQPTDTLKLRLIASRVPLRKEFDEETGLYYYGARYYEPRFSLWISVDPLVELYRNISPYAYVANNPIVYTDPDGRKIDPESQKEWNDQKHHIVDKRDKLQAKINKLNTEAIKKGWNAEKLAKKIGNKQERVSGLNTVISNLAVLEESAQTYSLNSGATNNKLSYDATTGNIVISYSGTALFAHEATHAGQFEIGDIAFASNGSSLAQDVYDEVASYKAQWAYNPSSVGGLSSTNQITASWVQGIKDPTSGDQPYKPGGSANTGISSVNVNSTRDELIRAYPHQESTLRQYPANSTLKSMIPTMYTKHSK